MENMREPSVFKLEAGRGKKIVMKRKKPLLRGVLKRKNDVDIFCGIPDDKLDDMLRGEVCLRIQSTRNAGMPVALYDRTKRQAYMLYPDGRRVYE